MSQQRDVKGQIVLHLAVILNDRSVVEALVRSGQPLDRTDHQGFCPVHYACWRSPYWQPISVCSYSASGYGLYDMVGNAYEWCSDWYGENYYGNSPAKNPKGPSSGSSWNALTYSLRVAYRYDNYPTTAFNYFGFRCVSGFSAA
ncbi:TPA: hypothetical protein EYN98_05490 [Candidatus Poribacteria bacterium]|nr:hypothetical protein [Candidatus Poribacteria bacterium]